MNQCKYLKKMIIIKSKIFKKIDDNNYIKIFKKIDDNNYIKNILKDWWEYLYQKYLKGSVRIPRSKKYHKVEFFECIKC